jgi:hypothetical protein
MDTPALAAMVSTVGGPAELVMPHPLRWSDNQTENVYSCTLLRLREEERVSAMLRASFPAVNQM